MELMRVVLAGLIATSAMTLFLSLMARYGWPTSDWVRGLKRLADARG